jgi:hypothetical protein
MEALVELRKALPAVVRQGRVEVLMLLTNMKLVVVGLI